MRHAGRLEGDAGEARKQKKVEMHLQFLQCYAAEGRDP